MKSLITVFFLMLTLAGFSQNTEETEIKQTITAFFEAFHKQDSVALKKYVSKEMTLQSVISDAQGEAKIKMTEFSAFLKSIVAIPKEVKFDERILSVAVQSDGLMANAWTDYEFYINEKFSHCGVNSFQLVKENKVWKIFYIVDTRRTDCKKS